MGINKDNFQNNLQQMQGQLFSRYGWKFFWALADFQQKKYSFWRFSNVDMKHLLLFSFEAHKTMWQHNKRHL